MPDEIDFFDLAALIKIKPDTTVERFGGMINSSFFDGANVLGTLSIKKLITFSTTMPGQNPITVTAEGKSLIDDANQKAAQDFDHLDLSILTQMSNGKSNIKDIAASVNVRPKDLAMHLYRLTKQDFAVYEFRSGGITLMLTENGFKRVKEGMPVKQPQQAPQENQEYKINDLKGQQPQTQPLQPMQPQPQAQQATPEVQQAPATQEAAQTTEQTADAIAPPGKKLGGKTMYIVIAVVVIIIAVAVLFLEKII
ncbi:MAG: hypothetical protein M1504_01780 [Candidatus Marsarchaeota archaeon]|nr:hypothetical protein [Candidatus Marsarchaeota archaeon]